MRPTTRNIVALSTGALFGLGLAISQLINPRKVLAFLDLAGDWDPSLALTMAGALAVALVGYRFVFRRSNPICEGRFYLPTKRDIDPPLVLGAVLFGLGWGLGGYCPGPAISALSLGFAEPVWFIAAMIAGGWAAARLS